MSGVLQERPYAHTSLLFYALPVLADMKGRLVRLNVPLSPKRARPVVLR